jgi:hypothetical protein
MIKKVKGELNLSQLGETRFLSSESLNLIYPEAGKGIHDRMRGQQAEA